MLTTKVSTPGLEIGNMKENNYLFNYFIEINGNMKENKNNYLFNYFIERNGNKKYEKK